MPTQTIDLSTIASVNLNGTDASSMALNGAEIWSSGPSTLLTGVTLSNSWVSSIGLSPTTPIPAAWNDTTIYHMGDNQAYYLVNNNFYAPALTLTEDDPTLSYYHRSHASSYVSTSAYDRVSLFYISGFSCMNNPTNGYGWCDNHTGANPTMRYYDEPLLELGAGNNLVDKEIYEIYCKYEPASAYTAEGYRTYGRVYVVSNNTVKTYMKDYGVQPACYTKTAADIKAEGNTHNNGNYNWNATTKQLTQTRVGAAAVWYENNKFVIDKGDGSGIKYTTMTLHVG